MSDNQWLQELKPGNEVIVDQFRIGGDRYTIEKVNRITNTQIITDYGKYNRKTGRRIGWKSIYEQTPYLLQCTPDKRKEIVLRAKRKNLIAKLESKETSRLLRTIELETLEKIAELLGIGKE